MSEASDLVGQLVMEPPLVLRTDRRLPEDLRLSESFWGRFEVESCSVTDVGIRVAAAAT